MVRSMGGGLGRLVRTARRLVASEEAPTVKYVTAWRSIVKPRVSLELDTLHVGDVADGEEVSAFSAAERFAAIGGDSGRLFVESMDGGASVRAFAAWCDVFLQRWDRLRARDGGWWSFDELTEGVFAAVLEAMPRGKAVGNGGLTIEMLRAAGPDFQALFYRTMMEEVRGKRVPEHWRRILYVLLPKPAHNNPELIKERREIALMAQDLKCFLHMVRREVHSRMAGRIHGAQMGGCAGYGCGDVSLALECMLQQNRRLGGEVWVLYLDLAQWFPSIHRGVSAFADLVHGLPPCVI